MVYEVYKNENVLLGTFDDFLSALKKFNCIAKKGDYVEICSLNVDVSRSLVKYAN